MTNEKKIICGAVFAVFLVSLGLSFWLRIPPEVDARAYDKIAINLAAGNGYVENIDVPFEKDFSIVRVGPGYEFFLAGVYKIFGHHYEAVWFLQAVLQALIALLVFFISKRIFGADRNLFIGTAAVALVGFSTDLLVASSMLLSETLGIFLMLCSVYLFFRYFDSREWRDLISCAIFLTFAVFVRSQLAALFFIFLILFILRKEWFRAFIFCLIVASLFSPWVIRNWQKYHIFMPFNAALGYNLWNGNHLGASGEMDVSYKPLIDYVKNHTPIETHQNGVKEFKKFVFQHPLEFAKMTFKRASIFFSFSRPSGFWPSFTAKQQAINAFFSLVYSVLIFTFGISGILFAIKKFIKTKSEMRDKLLFFGAMAICIPLSVLAILVETRYRYPIYPFLAVFGGLAIFEIVRDKKSIKIIISVFAILFLNSILDFALNFDRFWSIIKNIL